MLFIQSFLNIRILSSRSLARLRQLLHRKTSFSFESMKLISSIFT